MSYKANLSLIALCMLASGVASAATSVGTGTLAVSGSINASTCTVTPSLTAIAVTKLDPAAISSAAVNSELFSKDVTFAFTDCTAAGNTMTIKFTRDVAAPTGTGSVIFSAGFTYAGGTSTDSTKAPLYYRMVNAKGNMPLDGTTASPNNDYDISKVADKSSFSLPVQFKIYKAPFNTGSFPAMYAGTYSANIAYAIEYA